MNCGTVILFFLCWCLAVGLPLKIWDRPPFLGNNGALLRLYWELVPFVMTILVTFLFVKAIDRKNRIRIAAVSRPIATTLFGIVAGAVWFGLVLLIAFRVGILHIESKAAVQSLPVWIIAIFLNTVMQEVMVRGYMFSLLRSKYNLIVAIIATTAIFTLLHGGVFEAGFVPVLNVISTSVLLSLALVYTDSLWAPILMHFVWNAVGRLLDVVNLADDYPAIVRTTITGSSIVSGGSARIEGSIIVLVVNCLLIGIFLLLRKVNKPAKACPVWAPDGRGRARRSS